jgi:selenide, water dikinase
MNKDPNKLTSWSKGSGCGCKIAPAVLQRILHNDEELPTDPRILTNGAHNEDAAVMIWEGEDCLISTADFFTPVVDDPYKFGKIAAANSLSDVYAMGGKPELALGLLGWPVDQLAPELAKEVLAGARFICRMAGIMLAGGHSIESVEPFFGLSVNGRVRRDRLKKNHTAQEGDLLFITKPIGVGMALAASKRGLISEKDLAIAENQMMELNKMGTALGELKGVTAMTDITGFGLMGHGLEMCDGERLTMELNFAAIPQLASNAGYIQQAIYPDMTMKNYSAFATHAMSLSMAELMVLCDPQTSGGLLVAVRPNEVDAYLREVDSFGLQGIAGTCIGAMTKPQEKRMIVR